MPRLVRSGESRACIMHAGGTINVPLLVRVLVSARCMCTACARFVCALGVRALCAHLVCVCCMCCAVGGELRAMCVRVCARAGFHRAHLHALLRYYDKAFGAMREHTHIRIHILCALTPASIACTHSPLRAHLLNGMKAETSEDELCHAKDCIGQRPPVHARSRTLFVFQDATEQSHEALLAPTCGIHF